MKKRSTTLLILPLLLSIITPEASAVSLSTDDVTYEIKEQTTRITNVDIPLKTIGTYINVPNNKIWTFTFSNHIHPVTLSSKSLYVLDSQGKTVDSLIINDHEQTVTVLSPPNRYLEGETYTIFITSLLQSISNEPLMDDYQLHFTINSSNLTHSNRKIEEINDNALEYKFIGPSQSQQASELTDGFDLISINATHDTSNLTLGFHEQDPFIYTPVSFYTKLKEMMIKMYTPPVYY
ncbi:Ig-like domain-containing protein [Alkalihalobacterium chitinilyticum]|uniref:Ig-like domain-containing protein n=1 Tax=Alkalihalobacterium chitinilyticum TaxID=2980103 RepID=A0ABT5VJ14_9BACI|nr:Ig-like domain-containing protein [Alkalihalobacterium chitinilyticum]MDE5415445.1 Ig-like domain-containing protein [Alkalihalobacterium chitinilyticum]